MDLASNHSVELHEGVEFRRLIVSITANGEEIVWGFPRGQMLVARYNSGNAEHRITVEQQGNTAVASGDNINNVELQNMTQSVTLGLKEGSIKFAESMPPLEELTMGEDQFSLRINLDIDPAEVTNSVLLVGDQEEFEEHKPQIN